MNFGDGVCCRKADHQRLLIYGDQLVMFYGQGKVMVGQVIDSICGRSVNDT